MRLAAGMRASLAAMVLVACVHAPAPCARAQDPGDRSQRLQRPELLRPGLPPSPHAVSMDLERRLKELDHKLALGSTSQARALLEDLAQHKEMETRLIPRRARLAQLVGDYAAAAHIARRGLALDPDNPSLWRYLAGSLLVEGQIDSARIALDGYLRTSPTVRSAATVGIDLCLQTRRYDLAAGFIDSLRTVLGEPRFAALQKSQALLVMGRRTEAAVEISAALREQPYNLPVIRSRLLDGDYRPGRDADFLKALRGIVDGPGALPAERILLANLLLAGGDADGALAYARPLVDDPGSANTMLQNSDTLVRELELMDRDRQYDATVDYLLGILRQMALSPRQATLVRQRAADRLAEVCEQALDAGRLGGDPAVAVERFNDLLAQVQKVHPSSDRLYSAQINLARYMKDKLGDPRQAARRLERLLLDPDLPPEGLALTRLTLGECYLAAADTARGRAVLTQLGRDPEFQDSAGAAHYLLARLDLAEGSWVTARDRFAVVALDNPAAPYANDALELGLAVAEELDNPTGGPEILELYAPCVLADLLGRPQARIAALRTFVRETSRRVDLSEPQHLLERGMYDLAGALVEADSLVAARQVLRTLYTEHADSRYAPRAMDLAADLLLREGRRDEARDLWTRMLVQYPDDLFLADVRDKLKALDDKEDLP